MFALPDTKRILRSELYRSPSVSPAPSLSPSTETQLRARLASLFAPLESQPDPQISVPTEPEGNAAKEDEENEVEFRLFAEAVQTVCLRDKVVVGGEGGLVRARDPRVFYMPKADGERRVRLQMMATSGEDVLEGARWRAWGLEVPWRVKVIRVSGTSKSEVVGDAGERVVLGMGDAVGKRKKPGKKRRIILRGRKKKADELAGRKRMELERKVGTEKEKRARRNREKKLKRRAKERAKKVGGVDSTGSVANDQDSESGDND